MTENRLVAGRMMRCGYTTGSCAAAAAKAAAFMLLHGRKVEEVTLQTPSGAALALPVLNAFYDDESAFCGVRKDGGDDPDATHGALICAAVKRIPWGIKIEGGKGVGRVTLPGLEQPVGGAAINSTPRRMIRDALAEGCEQAGYAGGLEVVISVPGGEELAARTFNPRLGIVGGISILGTTGIVEPMSNRALMETIRAQLKVLAASGETKLLLTLGNIGGRFAREVLGLPLKAHVKCGNFVGETLSAACELGFGHILLIGQIAKLVKLGLGMTNTHSSCGDGRREALIACALRAGAPLRLLRKLDGSLTAGAGIELLRASGYLPGAMEVLGQGIQDALTRRLPEGIQAGFICFLEEEILTQSPNAQALAELWKQGG